jgi:prepilin-type N-terminal cleavage/methylation domain-containing protein
MKTRALPKSGFTLVEIMLVVGIIGFLAVLAIPNFIRARGRSQANVCINNLRQIQGATVEWALETKKSSQAPVQFSDIRDFLRGVPVCPAGGTCFSDSYSITNASSTPVCRMVPSGPYAHVLSPESSP